MPDRFKYSQARQEIIDFLKKDLMGPASEEEILSENPVFTYIIGLLVPQDTMNENTVDMGDQEVDGDTDYSEDSDYTPDEDDDSEPVTVTRVKKPSSIGISFYVKPSVKNFSLDVSWGEYTKKSETVYNGNTAKQKTIYIRRPEKEVLNIDLASFKRHKEYPLQYDANLIVQVTHITLKKGFSFITVYLVNKRRNPESELEGTIFQVEVKAYSPDGERIFVAEDICRDVLKPDEFFFKQRPIFGRGRGCAAAWGEAVNGYSDYVKSDFIPQYEYPSVSSALEGFDENYFSVLMMSKKNNKDDIIKRLRALADAYEKWISDTLESDPKMNDEKFKNVIGSKIIANCKNALARMREGINLLVNDTTAFESFYFMNAVMSLQRSIMRFSKKHGQNITCRFEDFVNPGNPDNQFSWRPFQIAFILMNLAGVTDPLHKDRNIVDLLYFPTGGGKTEAYLGLMAYVIAHRRLIADTTDDGYNRDGGTTIILRYTLRLLTTQQRDRIMKLVIAAEMMRRKHFLKYGKTPITLGFWVGKNVTPNEFKDLNPADPKSSHSRNLLYYQLPNCPFCGKPLSEDNFAVNLDKKEIEIYCDDKNCIFYKYGHVCKKDKTEKTIKIPIPVYMVDEEIYSKCPTILLSTVDKFASLPWKPATKTLFGKVDRYCSRHGYVAIGESHSNHKAKGSLPPTTLEEVKPFLPPELIIQDELHLITGPLGTIYGGYETVIEDMCTYKKGSEIIRPKYIVSTATIKNAEEQIKCLYAHKDAAQFPPSGLEIGDSFFIKEQSVKDFPFRKFTGICAPGVSVKTALLRIYAAILQSSGNLAHHDEWKDVIDSYYTLIGYFNSIRELGGTVRLLQDDIPKRITYLKKKYKHSGERHLNKKVEITSRMSSYQIPKKLMQLETPIDSKGCLDTAIATNMLAVGMDVDRLGLMVVSGQPKLNSEYIQATSRIGRTLPGLVVTLYNPYRPRDLSHYENFTGYHSQFYRFVEGTTATPFSARARDRFLHALIIAEIRLKFPEFAQNDAAGKISQLSGEQLTEIKTAISKRLSIVKPSAKEEVEEEINSVIAHWQNIAEDAHNKLYYSLGPLHNRKLHDLLCYYGSKCPENQFATLSSMRDVETPVNMYYYSDFREE